MEATSTSACGGAERGGKISPPRPLGFLGSWMDMMDEPVRGARPESSPPLSSTPPRENSGAEIFPAECRSLDSLRSVGTAL